MNPEISLSVTCAPEGDTALRLRPLQQGLRRVL